MTRTLLLLNLALAGCLLTSCIQDEPLNAECDITAVNTQWLEQHRDMLIGNPILGNDHLSFSIQKGTDRTSLDPSFTLTEGARITCLLDGHEVEANGITRNFSSPQTYTVHSQDGHWHKDYTVAFNYPHAIDSLHFEEFNLESTGRYQVWYEKDPNDALNPRRDYWASGNAGFAFTGMAKSPTDYPTASSPDGLKGACVKLVTRSTGSFGSMINKPIAAGNIFIGTFNAEIAVRQPLQATEFGLQLVSGKPVAVEGHYKYTPGEVYTDKDNKVCPELRDTAAIYAVVFEVDPDHFEPLDGSNVKTSPRVVMLAELDNPGEPTEWTHFSMPFRLMPGKAFSEERMLRDGYAITVVASSSKEGDFFAGAVGSTLYIDEFFIVWE